MNSPRAFFALRPFPRRIFRTVTVGALCAAVAARAQFAGVLTAYSPDPTPPASIVLFTGFFDSNALVSKVTTANGSPTEFDLTPGVHFTALYGNFTRPVTLPTFNGFTLRVSIALTGHADTYAESWSADGKTITVFSTPAGITRTFVGTTPSDAATQYSNYYASALAAADFQKIQATVLGIFGAVASAANMTDGAPQSSTSNVALGSFEQFGFAPLTQAEGFEGMDLTKTSSDGGKSSWSFSVYAENANFTLDTPGGGEVKGSNTRVAIPYVKRFSPAIAARGGLSFELSEIEGVKSFGPALSLGVPYSLKEFSKTETWRWIVTPNASVSYDRVKDPAVGKNGSNFLAAGGVTHLLEKRLTPNLILSLADQVSYHHTLSADLDFFPPGFEKIRQVILKNGLRARWRFAERWLGEGFVVDTRFLRKAQVKNYQSYGVGVSFLASKSMFVGFNTKIEDGHNYSGYNVGLSSTWSF